VSGGDGDWKELWGEDDVGGEVGLRGGVETMFWDAFLDGIGGRGL